jgi:hypothetical protein
VTDIPKGRPRGNREAKKPKKDKPVRVPPATRVVTGKAGAFAPANKKSRRYRPARAPAR